MKNFFKKKLPYISFVFIPIVYLWDPNWLGFLGIQPYWPIFWLLPWSMVYGSFKGCVVGLYLGLVLDAINPGSFTQIPGLMLCGLWFGRIRLCSNFLVAHFRYGLISLFGSFICGIFYYLQILLKNLPDNNFFFFIPSFKNVLVQIFLTAFFAPLLCSQLFRLLKISLEKNDFIYLAKK